MVEPVFSDRPHIELLQWLARGSLKQNLLRAVRLWVLLRFLYSGESTHLLLKSCFTFSEWREVFFESKTHPVGENKPPLHDPYCACAKTVADWLFDPQAGVIEVEWRQALQQHDAIENDLLEPLLQRRLFDVTRRSLQADFQILSDLGWLKRDGKSYRRVTIFPAHPVAKSIEATITQLNTYALNFLHPDLMTIAQNFSQEIAGVQRFFLQLDYIIAQDVLDQVDDWQEQFRKLWSQETPPIRLTYASARLKRQVRCIVYPVCIYYAQRAVYLCGFGQTPTSEGEWYNYRLDRIQQISPLSWTDTQVPQVLLRHYQQGTLPKPEAIQIELSKAWGFDFYLPACVMLLRFNRDFHDRYIAGTFRHDTFQPVSYQEAKQLIRQETLDPSQCRALLKLLQTRSMTDAYYRVDYRHGDTNVRQRLRAWRPHGEVLLPWDLRQAIAAEVKQEFQFYSNNELESCNDY